jgi:hypothetical protein
MEELKWLDPRQFANGPYVASLFMLLGWVGGFGGELDHE